METHLKNPDFPFPSVQTRMLNEEFSPLQNRAKPNKPTWEFCIWNNHTIPITVCLYPFKALTKVEIKHHNE
ncbi:hypothetical protein Lal_00029077 [Lupinus albus]|nr:hypothetical protein Lal_00029077 [Lupinus albus]